MKKFNFIFWGECIVIFALLLVISGLLKDTTMIKGNTSEKMKVMAREYDKAVLEEKVKIKDNNLNTEYTPEEEKNTDIVTEEIKNPSNAGMKNTKDVLERNKKTQIVVFGDSIWNDGRGKDGISELVMEQKDVYIYNCAIGGTTAAVYNESTQWDSWTSNSFNGMVYIVNDTISEDQLIPNEEANAVFKQIDFNQIDYVIIAYGLNDYFSDVPIYPKDYYDLTSYVGALRHGIHKIREKYPHIKFVIASPTYCEWFKGERQFDLGAYTEAARSVSEEMGTDFIDMYHAFGKTPEEKLQYLEDGIHLTAEGRWLYSRSIIDFLDTQK